MNCVLTPLSKTVGAVRSSSGVPQLCLPAPPLSQTAKLFFFFLFFFFFFFFFYLSCPLWVQSRGRACLCGRDRRVSRDPSCGAVQNASNVRNKNQCRCNFLPFHPLRLSFHSLRKKKKKKKKKKKNAFFCVSFHNVSIKFFISHQFQSMRCQHRRISAAPFCAGFDVWRFFFRNRKLILLLIFQN
jgi:hypothetical protein